MLNKLTGRLCVTFQNDWNGTDFDKNKYWIVNWFRQWFDIYFIPSHYMKQWIWLSDGSIGTYLSEIWIKMQRFFAKKYIWCFLQNFSHFVEAAVGGNNGFTLTRWPLGNLNEIFKCLIFQIISVIDGWGISCELALRWMSLNITDDKSTLVQVMAWCRQATSHYLSQCWPRSLVTIRCH